MIDDINNPPATIDKMSEDEALLLLWALISDVPEQEWEEFVYDLIYKNRFTVSHKVIDEIIKNAETQVRTINKGQVFYRARIYRQNPLKAFLAEAYRYDNTKKEGKTDSNNRDKQGEFYYMSLAATMMALENKTKKSKEIITAYNKWKRKLFKGFNAKDSGAPPADKTTSGRINPERISYLYLAEDPETAIYEVRPTIGQHVSVASFRLIDEVKIYDLTIADQYSTNQKKDVALFRVIQEHFSEPNTGNAFKYLPTQYLGEIIKQIGFDGIRYKSSLRNDGVNIVLFNQKKCRSFRSDIIKVDSIELKYVNPDIYELEKYI